jgi:tripartite-type tricarboxylate transporter receptor subunit TctC
MQFLTEESSMARVLASLLVLLVSCTVVQAQETFPSKPVTMIVPFPPGGVADITGRPLAAMMERSLKQPVVVVNRTGAGGALGMSQVAKSAPDGYTILMGLSSISIFPVSDRINGRQPAYEMKDFAPIALISSDPTVLVVRAESPYRTLKDFVDAAKANPGKINYSSSGVYGTLHVAMEIFANAAGIRLFHIPYQGGGPAVTALLGGQVDALASGPAAAIGQIKGGKMRALAAWSDKRLALMPEVPTFKELGYDAEFYIWAGVFAPVATPQPIVARLREAVRSAVNDPDFKAAMDKVATPISYLDAPEFQKFWDHDAKRLAVALEKIGKVEEKEAAAAKK